MVEIAQVEHREISRDEDSDYAIGPSNAWQTILTLRAEPPHPARLVLVVRVTDTRDPEDVRGTSYLVDLTDGTGTLEVYKYTSKRIAPRPEYWVDVVGWVELRAGQVSHP